MGAEQEVGVLGPQQALHALRQPDAAPEEHGVEVRRVRGEVCGSIRAGDHEGVLGNGREDGGAERVVSEEGQVPHAVFLRGVVRFPLCLLSSTFPLTRSRFSAASTPSRCSPFSSLTSTPSFSTSSSPSSASPRRRSRRSKKSPRSSPVSISVVRLSLSSYSIETDSSPSRLHRRHLRFPDRFLPRLPFFPRRDARQVYPPSSSPVCSRRRREVRLSLLPSIACTAYSPHAGIPLRRPPVRRMAPSASSAASLPPPSRAYAALSRSPRYFRD